MMRRSYACVPIFVSLCILSLLPALALADVGHESSLQAFVTSAHKRAFDAYSLLSYGAVRLTKSAIRGAVAVVGRCNLEEFDIGRDILQCNPNAPSLSVTGTLTSRMGQIHNGFIRAGRSSSVSHSVTRACSSAVEKFTNPEELSEVEISLIRDATETCLLPANANTNTSNPAETVFRPSEGTYSCYSVFNVHKDTFSDANTINNWVYVGNSSRNVIINIVGKSAVIRDFKMSGFNAQKTLIVMCPGYGNVQLFNARIHASILAPTTSFTSMASIVNGSVVSGSVTGEIVVLKNPYLPC